MEKPGSLPLLGRKLRSDSVLSQISKVSGISRRVSRIFEDDEAKSTYWVTVINLFNNMIGSGILSLADAAHFGSILGCLLVFVVVGWVQLKTMALMGGLCDAYAAKTYKELWSKIVGPTGAWVIDVMIGLNSFFACVSYCLLVCQYFTMSLTKLLAGSALSTLVSNKHVNMLALGVCVLLPLSLLKDLHQLKSASSLGLACMFGAMIFLNVDCLYWASTPIPERHCEPLKANGGCTSWEVAVSSFWFLSAGIVQTVAVTVSSLMCHYNIPKFYAESKNKDLGEFSSVVFTAGAFGILTYCGFAFSGFLRFGTNMPSGNVLGHFDLDSIGSVESSCLLLTYFAMSISLMMTMPLLFSAFRVSLLQLVGIDMSYFAEEEQHVKYVAFTAVLVGLMCCLGLVAPDLTLITRLKGSICGMTVSVILPAVMYYKSGTGWLSKASSALLGAFGFWLAFYGLYNTVLDYMPARSA